jgi:hypothetical protein
MWKRFWSTYFILLLLVVTASAQETIQTSVLSPQVQGTPTTPRVINSHKSWVAIWRQDNTIVARTVSKDGILGASQTLVTGLSPSARSFDLIFLRSSGNYLLAYEAADGLRVQLFNKKLARQAASNVIQRGVRDSQARFLLDEPSKRLFLFWLTADKRFLKRVELSATGQISGNIINITTAPQQNSIQAFSLAENPLNEIQFAILTQGNPNNGAKILGAPFRADGSFVQPEPFLLQQVTGSGDFRASAAFASNGTGVAVWYSGTMIQHRFLTSEGTPSGSLSSIENAADPLSNPTTVYDSKKEVFLQAWTKGRTILASAIDLNQKSDEHEFEPMAEAAGNALNAQASYDRASGRSIIVWEEQTGANYKVQATILTVHLEEFIIEGVVTHQKDYDPPYTVNGIAYSKKFHVKSNGKTYRAYLTKYSEIIGPLPKNGDRVIMGFEPFRKRYRGYIESIQIAN